MWKKSFSKIGVSQEWRIFEKWETSCPGIKGCFTGVPGCPASPGRVTGSNIMLHMCLCFCGNWSAIQKRNSQMLYCVVRVKKRVRQHISWTGWEDVFQIWDKFWSFLLLTESTLFFSLFWIFSPLGWSIHNNNILLCWHF